MPSADQIIEKYVQALGGKAAFEKITSRLSKGSIEIPDAGLSGTAEIYEKAPNKTVAFVDIAGFGLVREGFNGTVAWEDNPQTGMREKSGVELTDAKRDADFYREIKLKTIYTKMTLKGKEKVGDKEAYVIDAVPAEGTPEKWFFDTQSGLRIRSDAERESPQGKVLIESYLGDYREVDGIKIPFSIRQVTPAFSIIIKIMEVKHNVPIEDAKFNKPAQ
jgi:hypothetical protein